MTSEPSQRCRVVSWDQIGWLLSEEELLQRLSVHWQHRHTVTRDSCQHTARQRARHPPLSKLLELKAVTGNWTQNVRCSPPTAVLGLSHGEDQTETLALSGITSIFYMCFFPFEICTHSGTLRHADTEVPACHPHSTPFPPASLGHSCVAFGNKWMTQRMQGSFSALKGVQE